MLLYYLHNPSAHGIIPKCSSCLESIQNVRWHRFKTTAHNKLHVDVGSQRTGCSVSDSNVAVRYELCDCCFSGVIARDQVSFVPVRVTLVKN